jgi:4'-phosphopantetheinyl transferase EntD
LIEKILPDAVASAEARDDPPDAVLYPGEAELVSRAVDKRRREFRTARHCARRALRQLGLPPVAVLRGERGEPQWPPGIVGSLTHCSGYRAAAVARSDLIRALGIDAEPNTSLPAGVLDTIALPEEQEAVPAGRRRSDDLLGSAPVLCQGSRVQGMVPVDRQLARL